MKILITGGTGFIGSALAQTLVKLGHDVSVLSRKPGLVAKICGPGVCALNHLTELTADDYFDIIINLAGAPIFGARWTPTYKQTIRDSRIGLTDQIIACISRMSIKPKLLISGSAIGFYGNQGDTIVTEKSAVVSDFSQILCADWEAAALKAEQFDVRVCLIRTGLVIGHGGGLLQRMLLPFRLGLGGRIGNGQQWMSWIHREDWITIALAMIADESMQGAYNATSPAPVTNTEFTNALAHCLKRPALLPVPAWLLKLLLGEMSELILGSQRVLPERLLGQGFIFKYKDISSAILQALE